MIVLTPPAQMATGQWVIAVEDSSNVTGISPKGVTGSVLFDIGVFTLSG